MKKRRNFSDSWSLDGIILGQCGGGNQGCLRSAGKLAALDGNGRILYKTPNSLDLYIEFLFFRPTLDFILFNAY